MHAHTHTHACAHKHTHMHTNAHARTHTCAHPVIQATHIETCTHTQPHIPVPAGQGAHWHVHLCMLVPMCVHAQMPMPVWSYTCVMFRCFQGHCPQPGPAALTSQNAPISQAFLSTTLPWNRYLGAVIEGELGGHHCPHPVTQTVSDPQEPSEAGKCVPLLQVRKLGLSGGSNLPVGQSLRFCLRCYCPSPRR